MLLFKRSFSYQLSDAVGSDTLEWRMLERRYTEDTHCINAGNSSMHVVQIVATCESRSSGYVQTCLNGQEYQPNPDQAELSAL